MQITTVPNTSPTDHAFTLDTGETVVVSAIPEPFVAGNTVVNVHLIGRMVDPATGDVLTVGQSPIQLDQKTVGVTASALADGADLGLILANAIATEVQRVRALKPALESVDRLLGGTV